MYTGKVMFLILNLTLVGLCVKLLKLQFWLLGGSVMMISAVGAYSLANEFFNVGVLSVCGIIGYVVRKANFDMGPFVMSFILADLIDVSFAQSLLLGNGSASIFFTRPISATILAIAALYIIGQILVLRKTKAVKMLKEMPAAD